ncbi:MAG: helix-turn-helix domain-containing protein [Leucobacter sp.]
MARTAGEIDELELRGLLSSVAKRLEEALPVIVRDMRDLLAERIDDLGRDPQLVEMLQSSIDGNVATIFHILGNDIGFESLRPTTAAVEYAVRLAQRDVSLGALTRAYYLGQSMLLRRAMDEVDALDVDDESTRILVVRGIADVIHRYIDWILQYVTEVYEAERRRWWTARATTNAAAVMRVLRGDTISVSGFQAETGYSLEQRHIAAIAWIEHEDELPVHQHRIDQLLRRLGTVLSSPRPPLVTAVDGTTAQAWVSIPSERWDAGARERIRGLCSEREGEGIRLALGEPGWGVEGFRRSHVQADTARLVALGARRFREERTVAFSDPHVGLLSLLIRDPAAAAAWTRETLGSIADPGPANEAMRETLVAFYTSGENFTRTAEALGVHRNTVRHRVDRFEAERGAGGVEALEIALALRVLDLLGDDRGTA